MAGGHDSQSGRPTVFHRPGVPQCKSPAGFCRGHLCTPPHPQRQEIIFMDKQI